ncbi:MAG: hypothetical protein ACRDL1_00340 [Solirubrobacterales bacterium]
MIYIWIRSTTNWEDEEAVLAQLSPELRSKVGVWNDTFTIPFHVFRHRVREIARLNVSKVEDAVCARWEEIPVGSLVLPADDDDWFAPDVGRALQRAYDSRATGYYWIPGFIEVPINFGHRLSLIRRRVFPRTPLKWICTTNSYALLKRPETKRLLQSHVRASEWFEEQPAGTANRVERRLSVMNRTLGSQTSLGFGKPGLTRSQLIRKFRRYRALYRRAESPELAWCRPYLAMMADLMDQLSVKDLRPS